MKQNLDDFEDQLISDIIIKMKEECKWQVGCKLISAFPGTGKSHYCNLDYMPKGFAIDSDSSKFNKNNFPENYIQNIKEKISEGYARVFVSSHKEVRDALVKNGLYFTLIYPDKSLKHEYLERYKYRGNSSLFIELMEKNWDRWIGECQNQEGCEHIVLPSMIFISNVI